MFVQEHKSTADAQLYQTMVQLTPSAARGGDAPSWAPLPSHYPNSQHRHTVPSPSTHGPFLHPLDLLVLCISATLWAVNLLLTCWSSAASWAANRRDALPTARNQNFPVLNRSSTGFGEHRLVLLMGGISDFRSAFTLPPSPPRCSLLELGVIPYRSKPVLLE